MRAPACSGRSCRARRAENAPRSPSLARSPSGAWRGRTTRLPAPGCPGIRADVELRGPARPSARSPGRGGPRLVVLDNASLHLSKTVQAQLRALLRLGISLYYLPAYSPELNEIEPVFKQGKD